MHFASKTLAAIDAAIIKNKEEPFRKHLGASIIGEECARRIWYQFRWTLAEQFEPRMLRLFSDGHHFEPRMARWLKAAGIELWQAGEFGTDKALMRVSAHLGHFGGTPDFVGRRIPELDPSEPALVEVKTHNDKSFTQLLKEGIMRTKWKHFVQMQIYMGGLNLKWALYIAYNKNTSAIQPELVQFDEREYIRALERAEAVIWTQQAPIRIGKNPAHSGCKFCHLQRLCYFGDVTPARNCRSCVHSKPDNNGSGDWICTEETRNAQYGDNIPLNEAAQRAACELYTVNPQLKEST